MLHGRCDAYAGDPCCGCRGGVGVCGIAEMRAFSVQSSILQLLFFLQLIRTLNDVIQLGMRPAWPEALSGRQRASALSKRVLQGDSAGVLARHETETVGASVAAVWQRMDVQLLRGSPAEPH